MEWDFRVLDPEAFPLEHERYVAMLADGREDSIDPLWVAVFCMVCPSTFALFLLCNVLTPSSSKVLALSLEGFWSRPGGTKDLSLFRGLSERELQDLPSVWHDSSLRALQLGEWGGTPRIRTIQGVDLSRLTLVDPVLTRPRADASSSSDSTSNCLRHRDSKADSSVGHRARSGSLREWAFTGLEATLRRASIDSCAHSSS
jgi:hypothetical protein